MGILSGLAFSFSPSILVFFPGCGGGVFLNYIFLFFSFLFN